ncbi:DUF421 domain-containing protein [Croceiramulus getboli]|nr:DUF421 domain-containing protein [Flavobacteriaceae bacterium YJPT1-3]
MDLNYFFTDWTVFAEVAVGTVLLYFFVICFTRIFGLKSFSKMTGFDFVNTIVIGNLMAMTVATSNPKFLTGIFLIGILYLVNWIIAKAQVQSKFFRESVDNSPILLMKDGEVLYENLKKAKVTENELCSKLREANVLQLSQVQAVIFETTGDTSVLHSTEKMPIDEYILKGVETD